MRLAATVALALALSPAAALAAPPRLAALPSPTAPLSAAPPVGGGATASAEGVRHRVDATNDVAVKVDAAGAPFAVEVTQRLRVHQVGDYYFTINAPVTGVEAAPGSAGTPGLRSSAFLWEGFNPGARELVARAVLAAGPAAAALPLRISANEIGVTLTNTTDVPAGSFAADALKPQLLAFLAGLRRSEAAGRAATGGSVLVTSSPVPARVLVRAPLRVTGSVGARRIDVVLGGDGAAVVRYPPGRVRLTVRTVHAVPHASPSLSGRRLLDIAIRASLVAARARQYDAYLGNPDPTGRTRTVYRYATGTPPRPVAVEPVAADDGGGVTRVVIWGLGGVLAVAAAVVAWSRG